jgi:hypothetical protein
MLLLLPMVFQVSRAQNVPLAGMQLQLKGVPANGLVAQEIDLAPLGAGAVPGVLLSDGAKAISQFVPESAGSTRGLLLLQLPRGGDFDLQIRRGENLPNLLKMASFVVENSQVEISFDAAQQGGLPYRLRYKKSGRVIEKLSWRDRVFQGRGFELRYDRDAVLEAARGPVATVVRNRARYVSPKGEWPASQPQAVYTWIFWNAQPLIAVRARATQRENVAWKELHFLEFHLDGDEFDHFIGSEPLQSGALQGDKTSKTFSQWGALQKGDDILAQLGNSARVYDGDQSFGTYLVLNRPKPFELWENTQRNAAAWLWLGNSAQPATELTALSAQVAAAPRALTTSLAFEENLKTLRAQAMKQPAPQKRETLWRIARAQMAVQNGEEKRALSWLQTPQMEGTSLHRAGDFGLALRRVPGGVRVESVYDFKFDRELLAPNAPALWSIALHQAGSTPGTGADATLQANGGWGKIEIEDAAQNKPLAIRWSNPQNAGFDGISVVATAQPDSQNSAWRWNLKVSNPRRDWGISSATFPRLALADDGENTRVLYPFMAGMELRAPSQNNLDYSATYPSSRAVIQLFAVYHDDGEGLYVAMHDPHATTKNIAAEGDSERQTVNLSYEIPAPNMNVPATDFELSGQAVWQLLRGDWFDAGQIYKKWAQREADWWPKLGNEGRADTPLWMRELPGWALISGSGEEIAPKVLALQRDWSTPGAAGSGAQAGSTPKENIALGVHWYHWHQIPFDNDYPHYFPAKDGMAQSTREMQSQNIHLMPYINGRLWDTRDKGLEDYEFSKLAKPFAAKIERDGELVPFVSSYSSKESDGSKVVLAAMCPSTKFWQDTVRDLVMKLTTEVGVDAVYLDQIAASVPVLCMDTTHPHPVGGGGWWVKNYNEMLAKIRAELPPGKMLTSENTAEPYAKSFDGYLTWSWQYDGQVPLFASVYGGAIQMFGRAYRGGPDAGKALRMRAAQQLVWGEQLSWANPDFILNTSGEADFMRRAVRARGQLARYFYAGEMARPPHLGDVPKISADWQWQGVRIVTTDAVMSGLWKIARERKAVLMISNVSEAPIEIQLDTNQLDLGNDARNLKLTPIALDGAAAPALKFGVNALIIPPKAIYTWQVQW